MARTPTPPRSQNWPRGASPARLSSITRLTAVNKIAVIMAAKGGRVADIIVGGFLVAAALRLRARQAAPGVLPRHRRVSRR